MPLLSWGDRWHGPGGARELLALAWPLILSNSIWTLQITLDRVLLGQNASADLAASLPAVMLFWTLISLFQHTANYATTFVAQYLGAGRPHRVGPAIGQSLYFSLFGGLAFMVLAPFAESLMALAHHTTDLQAREATFLRCLCFAALPTLLTASANSFFAGRGASRTVLLVMASGLMVNGLLDYLWIFGLWGFPAWGIAGAGWATVCGSWASAILSLALMLRPQYRKEYATGECWRFERDLFRRLLYFGLPNGLMVMLDALAFTGFTFVVGMMGAAELAATSITITLNILVILPVVGVGQAVEVFVGRRLGEDRPDVAERTTWTGFMLASLTMALVAVAYFAIPDLLVAAFRNGADAEAAAAADVARGLLRFVAAYCLFDSANLVFSFALRGAGDTRFVTFAAVGPAWFVMVLPTYAAWKYNWGLYWAWAFLSAYVAILALIFIARLMHGKWKTMRVIEQVPAEDQTTIAEEVTV
jgi:MATE family multidrug resistance protein